MKRENTRVPHLQTALQGPLTELETAILSRQTAIEAWFDAAWQKTPAPVYGSVDLRNAGFKIAPVDMNQYAAGFNNLNSAFWPRGVDAMRATIEAHVPGAKRVMIVPENHTRNRFYWENVLTQKTLMTQAGYEVRIGSMMPDLTEPLELTVPSGGVVTVYPLERTDDRLHLGDFNPCLIWLNNDLSDGEPEVLMDLAQPIQPGTKLGWHKRLKSVHFHHYQQVALEFAKVAGIDSWWVNPLFQQCGRVNFMEREGEDCLARNVEMLLANIQAKYDEYGVKEAPFVVVKADAGTYGMSVMMVKSPDEVLALNRKQRTKMAASKGAHSVTRVIMQEGVYSIETLGDQRTVAEPVVYMVGESVIGGFYRVHKAKAADESLNAPGMHFEPMDFAESNDTEACPNRFYAYGVIARLSMLAAAREQAEY